MNQLTEYIKSTLSQGYTREQIKQYLISKGYDEKQIEDSFNELSSVNNQVTTQTNYFSQIQNYVYTYLQKGYTPQQLYDYLLKQGYDKKILNSVFSNINEQYYQGNMPLEVLHKHDISGSTLTKLGLTFIVVFIVATGFFFFMQNLGQDEGLGKLLDVEIMYIDESVAPGDYVKFETLTTNMGSPGRVDVYYNYILRNEYSVLIKKETQIKAFETTLSFVGKVKIPSDLPPGNYELEILAVYDSQTAGTKEYFVVEGEPVEVPEEDDVEEPTSGDPIDVEEPTSVEDVNYEEPTTPTTVSNEELFNRAIDVETKNEGISNCNQIDHTYLKNSCFTELASLYNDEEICERVDQESRDICYMGLIVSGNRDICDKVQDKKSITLCKQYELFDMADQYEDGTLTYVPTEQDREPDGTQIEDYTGLDAFLQ